MKTYIVMQDIYCEGNFGDRELGETEIHGVYSTMKKAKEKSKSITPSFFYASGLNDGKTENPIYIKEFEIDKQ